MLNAIQRLLTRPHVVREGDDFVLTHDVLSILAFSLVPLLALLIGIGCWRFAGWLAKRQTPDPQAALKVRVVACCAWMFALGMAVMLIPGMMNLEVRITSDRLVQSTGIWSTDNVSEFPFDEVKSIRERTEQGDFGPQLVWLVHWRNGRAERFDPCDLIEGNSALVADELRKRGVDFRSRSP